MITYRYLLDSTATWDHPSQAAFRWVSAWMMTTGPRPAHRNAEREVIFQRLFDWGQTLLNGRLYRHRFSAVSPLPSCKCNTSLEMYHISMYQMEAAVTFSWGVTLVVKKEVTGDKEGKAEETEKRWRICIRPVAIQVETRIRKKTSKNDSC